MEGFDLFLHVLFDFQESVTSPATQQGADGHKADDQRRLDTDTTATAQNLEKRNAAQSKETGVSFTASHVYRCLQHCKQLVAGPDSSCLAISDVLLR